MKSRLLIQDHILNDVKYESIHKFLSVYAFSIAPPKCRFLFLLGKTLTELFATFAILTLEISSWINPSAANLSCIKKGVIYIHDKSYFSLITEQFIGGTIALLTLSTAMAVFVVNFHFRGILKARPPYWVRVFVLRGLAYIVCMRKRTRVLMDGHHDENDSESYKVCVFFGSFCN